MDMSPRRFVRQALEPVEVAKDDPGAPNGTGVADPGQVWHRFGDPGFDLERVGIL
jgi:hypothetical protein